MAFPHFWLHKSDMGCASNLGVVPQDRELVHAQYLDTAEAEMAVMEGSGATS